jgi:hypothetical protein
MNFGKYAVLTNSVHVFKEEPAWTWTFRPPTSADTLEYDRWQKENLIEAEDPEGNKIYLYPDWAERAWRQLALSFGGTTIPENSDKPVAEGGKPILNRDASKEKILTVVKEMPDAMLFELWLALGEAFPFWGPTLTKEKSPEEEEVSEAS